MHDPHPWKPDPRDTRIPVAPPDTCSSLCSVVAAQEFPHLGVVQRNNVSRLNGLSVVVRPGLVLGLLHQSFFVGLSQTERLFAEHLVHRRRAGRIQATLAIPEQPRVDAQHMLIGRVLKRIVRQLHGCVKKGIGIGFGHGRSVARWMDRFHSYFPVGV